MQFLSGAEYQTEVAKLVDGAKQTIDIVSYDWRWYPNQATHPVQRFNQAIVRAVGRGVTVRAVLNSALILPYLKKVGVQGHILRDRRTVHTKMILFDNKTLVIGSHNLTKNAFVSNIETSVIVEVPEGYTRVSEFFGNLMSI